jgi:C-terminal processing protease CtpA/Prc
MVGQETDMKTWNQNWLAGLILLVSIPAMSQESGETLEIEMREAEARLTAEETRELERAREVLAAEAEEMARLSRAESEDVEMRMREAERRMADAARQVAELSMRQLPRVERIERIVRASQGPVLGVTVGSQDDDGPVDGVEILGVSPGGAAAEAGLRAGDVLVSVNGEALSAANAEAATDKLLDFMKGVEVGDRLDIEYLRNSKRNTVEVAPRPIESHMFAFGFDGHDPAAPDFNVHVAPNPRGFGNFVWAMHDGGFGDMELVKLTERLGSYFGTDEGLLVVRAPGNKELRLEDGDVILGIDGRTPTSVSHAMRILGSYQAGEELKIEIMRDKRKRSIEIEMPDNRQSLAAPPLPQAPLVVPQRVVVEREQRP